MDPIEANLHHIVSHSCQANPKALDMDSVNAIAFEARGIPKLIRLITHEDLTHRLDALSVMYNQLSRHELIVRALQHDALPSLISLLSDEEPMCRQRSAAVLARIALIYSGRTAILSKPGVFPTLLQATSDPHPEVRVTVFTCFYNVCQGPSLSLAVQQGLIPILARCIADAGETVECKVVTLETLQMCAEKSLAAITEAIDEGVIPHLAALLASDNIDLIEKAAEALATLCTDDRAKEAALDAGCIEPLVTLLHHEDQVLRINASSVLLAVSILERGQAEAIAAEACTVLMMCLKEENLMLLMNVIKTIGNLAVNPQGKAQLQPCVDRLETIASQFPEDSIIEASATEASRLLTWTP
eukprot:gnl/Trimastix_PCT/2801.p1 GENE.gnl/Trimastix_PCT/2801~~gnl/Trimastix_PCT/2801.p1  ORF type:complete len:358 (+),score=117.82 gnl/Trimastix_PCT/2801:65-1138(+)